MKPTPGHYCIFEQVDIKEWAPSFSDANTRGCFNVLGEAVGVDNWLSCVHPLLRRMIVQAKTKMIDQRLDSETDYAKAWGVRAVITMLLEEGIITEGEEITDQDIYKFGNTWFRHTRGFDGLLQEGWSLAYNGSVAATEEEMNARCFILIRGDDLPIVIVRGAKPGYSDGEAYKKDYPGEVDRDHQD